MKRSDGLGIIDLGASPSLGLYISGIASSFFDNLVFFLCVFNLSFEDIFSTNLNRGASGIFLLDFAYLIPERSKNSLSSNMATPSENVFDKTLNIIRV